MILSSDELEILGYLKSWNGKFITMIEICRSAGTRQKFKESPHWAKPLMARLVDMKLAEVNERGHYRALAEEDPKSGVVGDDYFPASAQPASVEAALVEVPPYKPSAAKRQRWISPHFVNILNESGKKLAR